MATITKRGKSFKVSVRRVGEAPIYKSFGTKREAEQFAYGIDSDILAGRYVPVGNAPRLGDALLRYAQEVTSKKRGAAQELQRIEQWRKTDLARDPMDKVRPADLVKWRDVALATNAPATVRLKLAIISNLYVVARKEWGIKLDNPVSEISLPRADNSRDRRLRDGEYRKLLRAAQKTCPSLADFIRLLIYTGMRRSELCLLRWSNVDLDRQIAHLGKTKNGSSRDVPLSRRAVRVLRRLRLTSTSGRIFPMQPHSFTSAFRRSCDIAGIRGLRLHDMRHEATSRLFEDHDLSVVEVSTVTGHKDLRMLKRYTHLSVEAIAKKLG